MPRRRWGLVSVSPCGVLYVFLHGNASNTDFTVFDASVFQCGSVFRGRHQSLFIQGV